LDHEQELKEIEKRFILLALPRKDGQDEIVVLWQGKMSVFYSRQQIFAFIG